MFSYADLTALQLQRCNYLTNTNNLLCLFVCCLLDIRQIAIPNTDRNENRTGSEIQSELY